MKAQRRGFDHVEETVERLVEPYEEHDRSTPRIQKAAILLTTLLAGHHRWPQPLLWC